MFGSPGLAYLISIIDYCLSTLISQCSGSKLTKDVITCIYEPSAIWVDSEWTASYDAELIVTAVVEANAINIWPWLTFIPSATAEAATGSLAAAIGLIVSVAPKFLSPKPTTVIADCTAAAVTNGASAVASATAATATTVAATITATAAATTAATTATITTTSHAYATAAFP